MCVVVVLGAGVGELVWMHHEEHDAVDWPPVSAASGRNLLDRVVRRAPSVSHDEPAVVRLWFALDLASISVANFSHVKPDCHLP